MQVIKPPAIKSGDKIAIVSPAGPPVPDALEQGVRLLENHGYTVKTGNHVLSRNGYLAGSDEERAADLNQAIRDPDIRCIICSRGGYGVSRILSVIDYDRLLNNPKIVIGFSDITALLIAIYVKTGLVTFHGPMMTGISSSPWSFRHMLAQITGKYPLPFQWPLTPDPSPVTEFPGIAGNHFQGRLVGGCLSILSTLSGTPWQPATSDHIVFLEDVGEAPYRIDRLLTHLINSGWFQAAVGIIGGEFHNCTQRPGDHEPTLTAGDVFKERIKVTDLPLLYGIPFGHATHNLTLPIGVTAEIVSGSVHQLESAVEK